MVWLILWWVNWLAILRLARRCKYTRNGWENREGWGYFMGSGSGCDNARLHGRFVEAIVNMVRGLVGRFSGSLGNAAALFI